MHLIGIACPTHFISILYLIPFRLAFLSLSLPLSEDLEADSFDQVMSNASDALSSLVEGAEAVEMASLSPPSPAPGNDSP